MIETTGTQLALLKKMGIKSLNAMQTETVEAISTYANTLLLSPTGSGKTLAFLLPIIERYRSTSKEVKVLILVPSRELAIQIETVARNLGSGLKINAVYGGRPVSKDKQDLKHSPVILIGTPGRIADHIRRGTIEVYDIETLILDEFDKSLEVGFHDEMSTIIAGLPALRQKILTSATNLSIIPEFVHAESLKRIDFLDSNIPKIEIKGIISPNKDKLETLLATIRQLGNKQGIIFCNFKDSISRVSSFLRDNDISHGTYHGDLEQKDRERSLIKFRNGTNRIIIATDLAARGLDIPEVSFIIHYHLPIKEEEFIHRNGRTARMHKEGNAYVLLYKHEKAPAFLGEFEHIELTANSDVPPIDWATIMISGGRKDKISKGDIAGLFIKTGGLAFDEIGLIEIKKDCAFVAVHNKKVDTILQTLNNTRLKKKKIRLTLL